MTAEDLFQMAKEYIKIHNKFPSISELASYSELPVDTITKVYKRWISQGRIVKKGNSYDLYREDQNKLFVEPKVTKPDNTVIEKAEKEKVPKMKIFVKILSGFIGIILMLCSIHFTFEFNKFSMIIFWSFCLSFSIVSFMSIAFTLITYNDRKSIKCFLFFLWIMGFIYSVFTAVSGQYNSFKKYLSNDKTAIVENKKEIIKEQIAVLKEKREDLLHWRQQETEYSLNPDLKVENPGTWITIKDGIQKLQECELQIEEKQSKYLELSEIDVVENETVYSWLCQILHIESNKLHFLIILFPSIFIDLCSGLCLMFAFSPENRLKN